MGVPHVPEVCLTPVVAGSVLYRGCGVGQIVLRHPVGENALPFGGNMLEDAIPGEEGVLVLIADVETMQFLLAVLQPISRGGGV
jgi:hypothetical protein